MSKKKKSAISYRINQELKFQYAKKQGLNEQLYKIHLQCASLWSTTWHLIQPAVDGNIQHYMDRHYKKKENSILWINNNQCIKLLINTYSIYGARSEKTSS